MQSRVAGVGVLVYHRQCWPASAPCNSSTLANDFQKQFALDARCRNSMQFWSMSRWEFNGSTHHPSRVIYSRAKTRSGIR
jgi:hypothetical protein